MQAFIRVRRPLCVVLLATQLFTACTSWKVESTPLPERYQADPPSSVRLWLKGGSRVEIQDSRWVNDSVAGRLFALTPKDTTGTRQAGKPIAVPASDITGYATKHTNALKTFGLVVGVLGAMFVGFVALLAIECGDTSGGGEC
jgi:hypothetical protein